VKPAGISIDGWKAPHMSHDSGTVAENTICGLLVLGIAVAVMIVIPPFIEDDAYISFRYARNLVTGHGLTYNIGERVEGYTNFLWVMLMTVPHKMGIDVSRFAHLFGSLLFIILLLAVRMAQIRLGMATGVVSWVALTLLATNKDLVMACRSGLETGLFVVLVTLGTVQSLSSVTTTRRLAAGGLIFGFAAMTRPEGVLFFGICFLLHCHHVITTRGDHRTILGFAAGFLLLFVPYCLWRFSYFGALLPNTYYAKVGHEVHHFSAGWVYLIRGLSGDQMMTFILVPFALLLRDPPRWIRGVLVLSACYLLYVISVGGDYMEYNRFIVPVVPLIVLVSFSAVSLMVEATLRRFSPGRRLAVVLSWCGLVILMHYPQYEWLKTLSHEAELHDRNVAIGKFFAHISSTDDLLCSEVIGAIGYFSNLQVLDVHGLVDPHIARQPFRTGITKIGHEKADLDYILRRRPRFLHVPDYIRSLSESERRRVFAHYRSEFVTFELANGMVYELAYFERSET
jgi:hypothetical protein